MILQDVFDDCNIGDAYFLEHGFTDTLWSAMYVCQQLGCPRPVDPTTHTWSDWLNEEKHPIPLVRQFLAISCTLDFDPPRNVTTANNMMSKRDELAFRIRTAIEEYKKHGNV